MADVPANDEVKYTNEPASSTVTPLNESLRPQDDGRVSQWQTTGYGVDLRSGTALVRDATQTRVLMGYQQNGVSAGVDFYGLKVSKAGFDVNTATADQLIFNSSQNTFKIVSKGTATISSFVVGSPGATNFTSGETTTTVAHGLSYTPAILAFLGDVGTNNSLPYSYALSTGGGGKSVAWTNVGVAIDSTNIYFRSSVMLTGAFGFTSSAFNVVYYLLQETAN